jgi:hypothetical protein
MLVEQLNWKVTAQPRMMRRLRKGRYEGTCTSSGKRVRIDNVDGFWELYLAQEFLGKWPLKRTALKKANALLTSEKCDNDRKD